MSRITLQVLTTYDVITRERAARALHDFPNSVTILIERNFISPRVKSYSRPFVLGHRYSTSTSSKLVSRSSTSLGTHHSNMPLADVLADRRPHRRLELGV